MSAPLEPAYTTSPPLFSLEPRLNDDSRARLAAVVAGTHGDEEHKRDSEADVLFPRTINTRRGVNWGSSLSAVSRVVPSHLQQQQQQQQADCRSSLLLPPKRLESDFPELGEVCEEENVLLTLSESGASHPAQGPAETVISHARHSRASWPCVGADGSQPRRPSCSGRYAPYL